MPDARPLTCPLTRRLRTLLLTALLPAAALFAALPARAVQVGELAPDFSLPATPDPASGALTARLADLRGHVVWLDFWASWCGPCKQSFPWMDRLQKRYGARGLSILAVDLDARTHDGETFLGQVPADFRVAFDAAGTTPRLYGVQGMPSSILVGPDGRVLAVHRGFRQDDTAAIEQAIAKALDALPRAH